MKRLSLVSFKRPLTYTELALSAECSPFELTFLFTGLDFGAKSVPDFTATVYGDSLSSCSPCCCFGQGRVLGPVEFSDGYCPGGDLLNGEPQTDLFAQIQYANAFGQCAYETSIINHPNFMNDPLLNCMGCDETVVVPKQWYFSLLFEPDGPFHCKAVLKLYVEFTCSVGGDLSELLARWEYPLNYRDCQAGVSGPVPFDLVWSSDFVVPPQTIYYSLDG